MIWNEGYNSISIIVALRRSDLTFEKLVTRTVLKHPKNYALKTTVITLMLNCGIVFILNAIITNGSVTQLARGV